ncbi:hypothetical protein MJO28_015300 [Puccinia striiformis f. sp. tritici]|uniref:Uncharacterized protein n=1 Tax=Puccinia striiformis f. sp. tritici TaxID=168172 RepID=A0ACC0DSJ9_9BASI|nr:hypothetical protein MJO28_015300 [Puccinia striiformis f. sp. tritici]
MFTTLPNPSTPQSQPGPDSEGPQSVLRRSSRNTTPVRRSGMIATSSISQRPITSIAPALSTQPTSSSNFVPSSSISNHTNSTISNNDQGTNHLDLSSSACGAQDSGGGNTKIIKKRKRDKDNDYNLILNYFEKPFHIAGNHTSEDPITYICWWCNLQVRGGQGSDSNLYSHCDEKPQKSCTGNGCCKQEKAIKSGVKLPPTVLQLHKVAPAFKSQKINIFFGPAEKFDDIVLNLTLTVWLIQHALPWNCVEDEELQASFHYTQSACQIFKQKWQAKSGQLLYLDLQTSMIERLQNNSSCFPLKNDVWTTKGNRYGFVGAFIAYVNDNWEYIVNHLSIKLVAWHHKGALLAEPIINVLKEHQLYGQISTPIDIATTKLLRTIINMKTFSCFTCMLAQTTDSGSNNHTMAKEMYNQLRSLPGSNWNPASMHIKCFCHKLALIVGAGLKKLGMRTPPPPQVRRVVLGCFPLENLMETIAEEDKYDNKPVEDVGEEQEESVSEDQELNGDDLDKDDEEEKSGDDENDSDQDEEQLDFLICKITGSAPWRQTFKTIALAKGLDLLDLIAGYDEFDTHVAKKSRSRQKDKSKSGHFNGILLDASNWKSINELNEELEVFMVLTKEMEGDGPTGALVFPKYYMLMETLIEKENNCGLDDPLYPMFQKMIKKLNVYLDKALNCETLVMATLLHPAFQLVAFEKYLPKKKDMAKKILNKHFDKRKKKLESKKKN